MNILFIKHYCVGVMVSEIPRVTLFGYPPPHINVLVLNRNACYPMRISYYQYRIIYIIEINIGYNL